MLKYRSTLVLSSITQRNACATKESNVNWKAKEKKRHD